MPCALYRGSYLSLDQCRSDCDGKEHMPSHSQCGIVGWRVTSENPSPHGNRLAWQPDAYLIRVTFGNHSYLVLEERYLFVETTCTPIVNTEEDQISVPGPFQYRGRSRIGCRVERAEEPNKV